MILELDIPSRYSKHHWCPGSVHRMKECMLSRPRDIQPSAKRLQFLWGFLSNLPVTTGFLTTWRFSRHAPRSNAAMLTRPGAGGNMSHFSNCSATGTFSCEGWLQSVLPSWGDVGADKLHSANSNTQLYFVFNNVIGTMLFPPRCPP